MSARQSPTPVPQCPHLRGRSSGWAHTCHRYPWWLPQATLLACQGDRAHRQAEGPVLSLSEAPCSAVPPLPLYKFSGSPLHRK